MDLTNHQANLLSWLRFYDWVTSGKGPPIPEDEVLENDDQLDDHIATWKLGLEKERKDAANARRTGGAKGGNTKSFQIG